MMFPLPFFGGGAMAGGPLASIPGLSLFGGKQINNFADDLGLGWLYDLSLGGEAGGIGRSLGLDSIGNLFGGLF